MVYLENYFANVLNFENNILVNMYKTYARTDYNSFIYYHCLVLIDALEHVHRHSKFCYYHGKL